MATLGTKPIRQCRGCALNLEKSCAIFHHPSLKWKERRCEGYNNPFYINHYETTLKAQGAQERESAPARRVASASKSKKKAKPSGGKASRAAPRASASRAVRAAAKKPLARSKRGKKA